MVIATSKKDHLRSEGGPQLDLVQINETEEEDPLRFHTRHKDKSCFIDLTPYAEGVTNPKKNDPRWNGAYKGRPELILELAPAIRETLLPATSSTVDGYMRALTTWWRLLDELETTMPDKTSFQSSAEFTVFHGQVALDKGLSRKEISNFQTILRATRSALKLRPLFWTLPRDGTNTRHLASEKHFKAVRIAFKHDWFAVVDRWSLADELMHRGGPLVSKESPEFAEQSRLFENYRYFKHVVSSSGRARPDIDDDISGSMSSLMLTRDGYSSADMLAGFYPSGSDVRAAFHLCLATTGWNPAVLLDLDVNTEFIEVHPTDTSRYIMRGTKTRAGGEEQEHEGLAKSQGSAAFILRSLIERSAPLRKEIELELTSLKNKWKALVGSKTNESSAELKELINNLEIAFRSPWLYFTGIRQGFLLSGIAVLDSKKIRGAETDNAGKIVTYLASKIQTLNVGRDADEKIPHIKPGDFRDAYARDVYHASGGNILAVFKALNHRSIRSTSTYVSNTLLKEEHNKLFAIFGYGLWEEIDRAGIVDPSILAKWSRDGSIDDESRMRLQDYRKLKRSRMGVGCKDPFNPPMRVDPSFVPDGKKKCFQHRCTLCKSNAVILPESLDGLCMRMAELMHLKERMGIGPFLMSDYSEEAENTELALSCFEIAHVKERMAYWEKQIAQGIHRMMEFNGV